MHAGPPEPPRGERAAPRTQLPRGGTAHTWRRALARGLALLGGTALALCGSEWLVRVALPVFDPTQQLHLTQRGELPLGPPGTTQRLRKNTGDYDVRVHFGPRGFRDPRDVADAREVDLLVAGDSFAFGWGVREQERCSNLLELELGVRVFNVAIPGCGVDGYAAELRHARALGARARRLVLSLHLETDLSVCYEPPAPGSTGDATDAARLTDEGWEPDLSLDALKSTLHGRSALYALATTVVHQTPALRALAVRAGVLVPNLDGVSPLSGPGCPPEAVAAELSALLAGYEATVLLVPSRGLWLPQFASAEDRAHRALVAALERHGLAVVDPRAAFEATGEPLAHHFAADGHWNARGHRVAAALLAQALAR